MRCHNESLMIYNKRAVNSEYYTAAVFQERYIEIDIKAIYCALYLILLLSKNVFWPASWLNVCSCFSAPFLPCFYGSMNLSPLVYCDFIQQLWCLQVLKAINHHQPDVQCRELGRETAIDYFVGLFYFRVQGRLACSILSSKFTNLQCNYWLLLVSWEAS